MSWLVSGQPGHGLMLGQASSLGQSDGRGGQRRVMCTERDLLWQEGLWVEIPQEGQELELRDTPGINTD